MIDCPDAEIRDQLPDLLHGRLDAAAHARVAAHVSHCADCTAELALLRAAGQAIQRAPSVDVAAIVAVVPTYHPATRRWASWRVAAAVLVLAGGASSLVMLQRQRSDETSQVVTVAQAPVVDSPVVAPPVVVPAPVPAPAAHEPRLPAAPVAAESGSGTRVVKVRELALGGSSLGDLSDRELAQLLKAVDALDAVPSTDVESGSLAPGLPRRSME